MPSRAQPWLACVLGLIAISACGVTLVKSELGAECGNGSDDDLDGDMDCSDADCHAESMCKGKAPSLAPAAPIEDHNADPHNEADAATPPPAEQPVQSMQDAGVDEPDAAPPVIEDAAVEAPDGDVAPIDPCSQCTIDEVCENDTCVPATPVEPAPTRWRITGVHTVVPRAIESAFSCIATPVATCGDRSLDYPTCWCAIDPQVEVYVSRGGGPLEPLYITPYELTTDSADWVVEEDVVVELSTTDQLVLKVVDANLFTETVAVFACIIDATSEGFATGTVGCEETFPSARIDRSYTASITADVVRDTGEP